MMVQRKAPMKPSHVLFGDNRRNGVLMNLRPNSFPQKNAKQSLQITSDTGNKNQKRPKDAYSISPATCISQPAVAGSGRTVEDVREDVLHLEDDQSQRHDRPRVLACSMKHHRSAKVPSNGQSVVATYPSGTCSNLSTKPVPMQSVSHNCKPLSGVTARPDDCTHLS